MLNNRPNLLCLLFVFTALASGCSKQPVRFPVAGQVLIDGEPLTIGSIQFVPESGRPVASKIREHGSFRLTELSVSDQSPIPGIAKGKYRIAISSSEVLSEDDGEMRRYIPARYADFRTSGLEQEISKSQENLVIELTWEGAEENDDAEDSESDTETSNDIETNTAEAKVNEAVPATKAEQIE